MARHLPSVALLLSALCVLCIGQTNANVIGFDFGTSYFKITLVKPATPFSIVENVTSKRKTESMMTIDSEERKFGVDSFNSATKFPKTTFTEAASFLGREFVKEEVDRLKTDRMVMNEMVQDDRGLIAWQTFTIDDGLDEGSERPETTVYFTEEIVAQILGYGRFLAERQAEGPVKDAVITVPSYYSQEQRRMLVQSAELAGLHVVQLVHENTAAATMFGIDRLDKDEDLYVLYYNMGGIDTEASVVRYSAVSDARNKTSEYIEVLGEGYDKTLGGIEFDHVLFNILADRFNALPARQGKPDVRENARAVKRLFKESNKIKDILSANKQTNVKIPELLDYVTLQFDLHRSEFEEAAAHLFERVAKPVEQALRKAKINPEQINQVEILGGGIRVPKAQDILKEVAQTDTLNVHLNGDEAMCFGSAFIAANSSSSYQVRKVYLTQHPEFDVQIKISPLDEEAAKEAEASDNSDEEGIKYYKDVVLYKTSDYLGQKKTINLSYDKNMKIEAFRLEPLEDGADADAERTGELLVTYTLDEIEKHSTSEMAKKEDSTTPKLSLQFEFSRSQFFSLLKAQLKIEETVVEEIIVEKKEEKKEEKKDEESSDEKSDDESEEGSEEGSEDKKEEESESSESEDKSESKGEDVESEENAEEESQDEEASSSDQETEAKSEEPEKEIKTYVKPHVFDLKTDEQINNVRMLNEQQMKDARKRTRALERRDKNKRELDEAKNFFEAQIYELRAWLNEDSNSPYVIESEREEWIAKCSEEEDWLDMDGWEAGLQEFKTRGKVLSKQFDIYKNRLSHYEARKTEVPNALEVLKNLKDELPEMVEKKPWISEEEQKDVFDRIEEAWTFIEEKVIEQNALELHEEPVLDLAEVSKKVKKAADLFKKVSKKKKPKDKKPKDTKKDEEPKEEGEGEEQAKESNEDFFKADL